MNKPLVMTQGIISNDKSGDTNLTDTNCHWYSKVFLPLTFLFIIIKILLDEATMNLWPTGRPPMPLLVMRLGELGRLIKLTGGLRWLSWWLWRWPMVIDQLTMAKPWYLESGGWLGDDGQLPLHEPQVSSSCSNIGPMPYIFGPSSLSPAPQHIFAS